MTLFVMNKPGIENFLRQARENFNIQFQKTGRYAIVDILDEDQVEFENSLEDAGLVWQEAS